MATQTTPNTASSSSSVGSIRDKTFTGVGNLIRLLPTGTVFLYQFLNPILTNNGSCSNTNKYVSSVLFALCGISCLISTFTDSYRDDQGNIHYGIATFKGFWPTSGASSSVDFKSYRLQIGDFVHATLSLIVFSVLSLLDNNTVECFYPSFESTQKALLKAMPPVIGSVAAAVFVAFPNKRHGIGYPSDSSSSSTSTTSSAVQTSNAGQKA